MNRIKEYLDALEKKYQDKCKLDNTKPYYTQSWLATKMDVRRQTISKWCLNLSQPKFAQMVFIAKHLKVRDVRKMYKEDKDV